MYKGEDRSNCASPLRRKNTKHGTQKWRSPTKKRRENLGNLDQSAGMQGFSESSCSFLSSSKAHILIAKQSQSLGRHHVRLLNSIGVTKPRRISVDAVPKEW